MAREGGDHADLAPEHQVPGQPKELGRVEPQVMAHLLQAAGGGERIPERAQARGHVQRDGVEPQGAGARPMIERKERVEGAEVGEVAERGERRGITRRRRRAEESRGGGGVGGGR